LTGRPDEREIAAESFRAAGLNEGQIAQSLNETDQNFSGIEEILSDIDVMNVGESEWSLFPSGRRRKVDLIFLWR
jgi:hypothetical protein